MHRKITSFSIALLMLLSILSPTALADSLPWETYDSLHGIELQRSMVRAEGDGYEYFTYSPTTFGVHGSMGGIQLDLDNDGADEYLHVTLSEDSYVSMTIYENTDGQWTGAAHQELYEVSLTCNIQANDVFLKHDGTRWIIFNENWRQENSMADGAAWDFAAWHYDGSALNSLTAVWLDGTDISGDLDNWLTDKSWAEYRPELAEVAQQIIDYDFDIDSVYWANMICEQDPSLTVITRLFSVQDVPYSVIMRFTGAGGNSQSGFRSVIVDCSLNGYSLAEEHYLSNNQPGYADDISFGTGAAIADDASEYVIPDSDVRALTKEELSAYDRDTLALIRNEILARYGYPFQKQKYKDYFGSKSWYTRNENFTYGMLTSLEMENIELIKKLESAG